MLFTSQVVSAASGSAGGLTASRNRYGMYFRSRSVPVNPQTTFQQSVRANLAAVVGFWAALTDAQRDGWDTYGANVSMLNKLGQAINLTGFSHYVRSNTPRIQAGLSVVDDAPEVFVLPSFTPFQITATAPAGVAIVSSPWDSGDPWVDLDDGGLTIAISRPVSPTINYFKGPFRFSDFVEGDSSTPPTSPTATVGPFTTAVGQRVYTFTRLLAPDGGVSAPQISSAIVA